MNNGLVDVLGGLKTAVAIAKARIGVKPDESVKIVRYPEKEDPIASIIRMIKQEDDEDTEAGDGGDAFASKATRATLAALAKEFINSQPKEWQVWWRSLPPELREQAEYSLQMALLSREEHILAVLPWMVSQR